LVDSLLLLFALDTLLFSFFTEFHGQSYGH